MNTTLMTPTTATSPSTMSQGTHRTWALPQLPGTGMSAPVNGVRPVFGAELGGVVTGPVGAYDGSGTSLGSNGTALIAQDSKAQDVRDPLPPRDRLL